MGTKDIEMDGAGKSTVEVSTSAGAVESKWYSVNPKKWTRLVGAIVIGDFMHNFVDGIAIAIAFKICDPATGWIVALGAVLHEVPQEVGDFLLMVLKGNMTAFEALFVNFLCGLSCVIGAAIALGVDITGATQGIILLFAAGQCLWIAAVECFPTILEAKSMTEFLQFISAVALGVLLVSLVLTVHKHCGHVEGAGVGNTTITTTVEAADPHAGHNH